MVYCFDWLKGNVTCIWAHIIDHKINMVTDTCQQPGSSNKIIAILWAFLIKQLLFHSSLLDIRWLKPTCITRLIGYIPFHIQCARGIIIKCGSYLLTPVLSGNTICYQNTYNYLHCCLVMLGHFSPVEWFTLYLLANSFLICWYCYMYIFLFYMTVYFQRISRFGSG